MRHCVACFEENQADLDLILVLQFPYLKESNKLLNLLKPQFPHV